MKQLFFRRCAAVAILLSFCVLTGVCAFADDQTEKINYVHITAPASVAESAQLTGPDVGEDGSVLLQEGKPVSFTLESPVTMGTGGMHSYDGVVRNASIFNLMVTLQPNSLYYTPWLLLYSDENGAWFGLPDNEAGTLRIAFEDVQLLHVDRIEDTGEIFFSINGTYRVEVRFPVTRVVQRSAFENTQTYRDETDSLLQSAPALPQPYSEAVFRATVQGQLGTARNSTFDTEEFDFSFSTLGADVGNRWDAELEYDGRTQQIEVGEGLPWGYETTVLMNITDWGYAATGGGSVVATATGATALGLGGSAVANALAQPDALPARRRDEELSIEETPELPEEDSPEVSLSMYKPFSEIVNTKGAAVDIQLTVNGGEGLRWHYLPTAICPGGLKAVVPTVVGMGSESTLVLGLTGAAMKQAHCPVFVTVIAWAVGPNGKVLKTSGTMEVTLHRGGLEAKRNADGSLEVISYADGNLDGLSEKRVLKETEYTLEESGDGTITVRAKEKRLGTCTLEIPKDPS